MRKWMALSMMALSLAACNNQAETEKTAAVDSMETEVTTEGPVRPDLKSTFPELYRYIAGQQPEFTSHLEEAILLTIDSVPVRSFKKEDIADFLPYLRFNADSTLALDYVTYNYILQRRNGTTSLTGGGPDTEVALLNFKDSTRRRILFRGPSETILDAYWEDPETVVMAGAVSHGADSASLVLYRYKRGSSALELYEQKEPVPGSVSSYAETVLNAPPKTSRGF
ncbi:MAG TPA: hypothetical protein VHK91_10530 [Flavisolibacter sp.]|nr:hypothetical protein [Flavisolibacter sp.]